MDDRIIPEGFVVRNSGGKSPLTARPKILCVSDENSSNDMLLGRLRELCDTVEGQSLLRSLSRLNRESFSGIFVSASRLQEVLDVGRLLENERILSGMPDGVVLLDTDNTILWSNEKFRSWCQAGQASPIEGSNFYIALGSTDIVGPDLCPFHTALSTGRPSGTTLRVGDSRYFRTHVAPVPDKEGTGTHLIVTVRDVSAEVLQDQKMAAIHKAGVELGNLMPAEVFEMSVPERIELLKSNILKYTQDLFHYDVIEIRVLGQDSGVLEPLLSVGLTCEAAARPLLAQPQANGVTGYVAATGISYLCEDTLHDPLYIEGCKGAKSSLTVPLILHDQVIGTFNVESPNPRAFTETDRKFLEIFSRDVAVSLNTLELLVAQQANTAQESVEAIHRAVALPVDEILADAVNVMEQFIGHDPEVANRLQRILKNARDIKQVIQKVGQEMTLSEAVPASMKAPERPKLCLRRVLVVDADDTVRQAAHQLLERYGCVVETARSGGEAIYLIKASGGEAAYDVIISDVRLPDMDGFQLYTKLGELMKPAPMVLMTGFGYDPGHAIVNCRRAGLPANSVLYKPFRLDQLLNTVEATVDMRIRCQAERMLQQQPAAAQV